FFRRSFVSGAGFHGFEQRGDERRAIDDAQPLALDRRESLRGGFVHETDTGHVEDDDAGVDLPAPGGFQGGERFGRQRAVQAQFQDIWVAALFGDSQHCSLPWRESRAALVPGKPSCRSCVLLARINAPSCGISSRYFAMLVKYRDSAYQRLLEQTGGDSVLSQGEEILHHISEGIAAATGEEFFRSLARHLASALEVRYSFLTECADEGRSRVRALAFWDGSGFADNVEYALAGTPCEKVIEGNFCCYPERLQSLFPQDTALAAMAAESFAGVPMANHRGEVLGHLVVMDNRRRAFGEQEVRILRIFATRATAELERLRAERQIRQLNAELSALLDINRAVGRHLSRDGLFAALAGCLKNLLPTDRFGVELPLEGGRLQGHILSADALAGRPAEPAILPAAGTACDWVLRRGEGLIAATKDELRERFAATYEVMAQERMESLCALPLLAGERALGALFFMSAEKNAYAAVRWEFLEQVASQVAIAVANMKSYEEIAALNAGAAAAAARRRTVLDINNAVVTKL